MKGMMQAIVKLPIRLYRWTLSPLIGGNCRYQPTCSAYAMQAIDRYGVLKGGFLAAARLLRCHPFSRRCAHDPVP